MPEISNEWHPTKNGELQPSQFSHGSEKRVWWQCRKHSSHEWQTAISNRCSSGKSECPYCTNKTEEKLFNYLHKKYTVKRQFTLETCKRLRLLPFDICLPYKKIIIELDGPHHFKKISNWLDPVKMLNRDIYKIQQAEQNGYKVVRIAQVDVHRGGDDWLDAHLIHAIEADNRDHTFISEYEDLYDKHIELYLIREAVNLAGE
jgi:very-short-patch-repair endonuclease